MNRTSSNRRRAAFAILLAAAACGDGEVAKNKSPYESGEMIYKNVCIACHAADPAQPGALGPAVAGSSRELLEHRVLRGTYPPGYESKQGGKTMPQFPHLEDFIDDLAAYLAVPKS